MLFQGGCPTNRLLSRMSVGLTMITKEGIY